MRFGIFFGELKKLLTQKMFWLFLVVLLAVNTGLLYREISGADTGYDMCDLKAVYEELDGKDADAREEWLTERLVQLQMGIFLDYYDDSTGKRSLSGTIMIENHDTVYPYEMYTDSVWQEISLISHMLEQTDGWMEYADYLDYVDEQAEAMTRISFLGTSPYILRNSAATTEVYHALENVRAEFGISEGVKLVTDWRLTDILLAAGLIALVLYLVWKEWEEGLYLLLRPTKHGCGRLYFCKFLVFLMASAVMVALFYGINLCFGWGMVGLGNLDRSIQSLNGYLGSPWAITVGQYLALFFLCRILTMWMAGSLIFALSFLLRQLHRILTAVGGVLAVEVILWRQIAGTSRFGVLHKVNLVSLTDVGEAFASYSNMNLFGFPVNELVVRGCVFGALGVGILVYTGIHFARTPSLKTVGHLQVKLFANRRNYGSDFCSNNFETVQRKKNWISKRLLGTRLWMHELYKVFFTYRGIVFLCLAAAITIWSSAHMTYYTTAKNYYYQTDSEQLLGKVSSAGKDYLEEKVGEVKEQRQELALLEKRYAAGEISQAAFENRSAQMQEDETRIEALQECIDQYNFLVMHRDENVEYIDQTGWNYLFGDTNHLNLEKYTFVALFCLILALTPVFTNDYTTNIRLISRTTKNGRTRQVACVLGVAGIFAVLLSIATYLPNALWMTRRFVMEIRQISVHSIMGLQGLIALLYINEWWMLMALMRALGMLLSAGVVLLFSRICKNTLGAVACSFVCLLFPLILHMLGVIGNLGILYFLFGFLGK